MSATLRRVSAREAHELVSHAEYTYIDVRAAEDFAEAHPRGAVNVPFEGDVAPFVAAVRARFSPDAKLVVGCRMGVRSLVAARALVEAGFVDVVDQRAGWDGARDPFGRVVEPGWKREGLPFSEGPEPRS